jgi:hypothetical protein
MLFEIFMYVAAMIAVLTLLGQKPQSAEELFDELFNDGSSNTPIDLPGTDRLVSQIAELWAASSDVTPQAAAPISEDTIVPFIRPLRSLSIRELKKLASGRIKNYSSLTKLELVAALQSA